MDQFDIAFESAVNQIEQSISATLAEISLPVSTDVIEQLESTLDGWDYCYAILIGMAGTFLSTNEKIAKYLEDIHSASSGISGEYDFFQKSLGTLLHHEGDNIDKLERAFINREHDNAYCLFHRLLWGHDILDIGEDNPFRLMINQKGIFGILQAVRHLLADTMSKQGLPLPGSSYLDYINEKEKTSNYLIKIATELSDEAFDNKMMSQEIYSHMMTIRAQDFASGITVTLLSDLYFKIRKINNELRCSEIKLIGYAINFFGEAIVGAVKQKGIPYINIPLGIQMAGTFGHFCIVNAKEINALKKETVRLHSETDELCLRESITADLLPVFSSAAELLSSEQQAEQNFDELLKYFEGGA